MSLTNAYTVLYDSSDVETGTAANPLRVDPTGTTPQPVTGTVTANQGTPAAVANAWPIEVTDGTNTAAVTNAAPGAGAFGLVVRVAGSISATFTQPSTGTITAVNVAVATTTILAANASRLGAILYNNDGTTYVALAAGATSANFTVRLTANSYYEVPFPVYTGIITGSAGAGTNTVYATELT